MSSPASSLPRRRVVGSFALRPGTWYQWERYRDAELATLAKITGSRDAARSLFDAACQRASHRSTETAESFMYALGAELVAAVRRLMGGGAP